MPAPRTTLHGPGRSTDGARDASGGREATRRTRARTRHGTRAPRAPAGRAAPHDSRSAAHSIFQILVSSVALDDVERDARVRVEFENYNPGTSRLRVTTARCTVYCSTDLGGTARSNEPSPAPGLPGLRLEFRRFKPLDFPNILYDDLAFSRRPHPGPDPTTTTYSRTRRW